MVQRAIGGHDAFGLNMIDLVIDQVDILAGQHAVPMIVAQHTLAIRRIIGCRLTDQFGIMTDFARNMRFKLLADLCIGCVQGMRLIGPVAVDLQIVVEGV